MSKITELPIILSFVEAERAKTKEKDSVRNDFTSYPSRWTAWSFSLENGASAFSTAPAEYTYVGIQVHGHTSVHFEMEIGSGLGILD